MGVLVAQLGARMHYAVPRILYDGQMLSRLYTDICAVRGWPRALHLVPPPCRPAALRRLLGRVPHGIPRSLITAFTGLGLNFVRELAASQDPTSATRVVLQAGSSFCRQILKRGIGDATAVYTFNGAGLELLEAAKGAGLFTIMEQTIAPAVIEDALLDQEKGKYPDWSDMRPDEAMSEKIARESAEWEAADLIVCGSQFVADGIRLAHGPTEKCIVVPYGVDRTRFVYRQRVHSSEPLRVLTVGAVGLRKGSPYVLEAAAKLRGVAEFRLVGQVGAPLPVIKSTSDNVRFIGPVPRSEVSRHFEWADVFLLPSICEGSATVTYEAMMSGLPVICTPNTGSIVESGINGLVIQAGAADPIVEAVGSLARDRRKITEMSHDLQSSSQPCSLAAYQGRLLSVLRSDRKSETQDS